MAGVFLSYSRANRPLALQVLTGLRAVGVEVWWDEDMPGVDWQEELARQINTLSAVIVLWTPDSIASKNVRDEARLSQHTDKLINLLAGVKEPPFPFDRVNGLPLDGWTGAEKHGGWTRLIKTVEDHLVRTGETKPGALMAIFAAREQAIRDRSTAVTEAQAAHQAAQREEADAAATKARAAAAFDEAQEQLRQVVKMNGSLSLTRTAQADLDAAAAANETADAAAKAASAAASKTSRALTQARKAFDALFDEAPSPPDSVPIPTPTPDPAPVPTPTPIPEPVPGPVPPVPDPLPKPKSKVLVFAIQGVVGLVVLLVLINFARGLLAHKPSPPGIVLPETAAGFDQATKTLSAGIANQPKAGKTLAELESTSLDLIRSAKAKGDYATEMSLAAPLAAEGGAEEQYDIGMLYVFGLGTAKNPELGRSWIQKAANQGYAPAQTGLGMLLGTGRGGPEDDVQAFAWFQKAAAQGDADAQYNLGVMTQDGKGGAPRDLAQARMWFTRAANGGSADAKTWLAAHPG